MIYSEKKQKGLTFISSIFILWILAFFYFLIVKITPMYINHGKVVGALYALEKMLRIEQMSQSDIKYNLNKRFNLNDVKYVTDEDINIKTQGNYVMVEIEYERVERIVANLSILVEFYESFEAGG